MLVKDTGIILAPDNQRVIARSHIPFKELRVERIISRVLSLDESDVQKELKSVVEKFSHRHHNFEVLLERQFAFIRQFIPSDVLPSRERRLLIGSFFLAEYSFESAALFNPSIVPHPDQSGLPPGSLRFIMSLRATGEGHISSLTFCSGYIDANYNISIDEIHGYASTAEMKPNTLYEKVCFAKKIREMDIDNVFTNSVLVSLSDQFTIDELQEKLKAWIFDHHPISQNDKLTFDKILWLAQCNYEAHFDPSISLSERVIFPISPSEQNGIEDARFVLFTDDDGNKKYYATYTAYDGKAILPQLIETENFEHFKMITLNGSAAVNKGLALFPRKIHGRYAMISRQDNENLFLMYSDNIHFWHESVPLMKPSYPWEFMQIGNCGSPIETEHGWLLLTHGVGSFRQYSIGAILLDKKNPSKIIGRLREPLIHWTETNRSGYVPNVVYTCGALIHKDMLVLPYAMSDKKSTISLISISSLLEKLLHGTS
ncbi:MAG: glycosidase [Chlorobiaceae bacterium]|nr:glycosidase [Chlorobiaceae bacterium]